MRIRGLRAPTEVQEALRHGRRSGRFVRAHCPYCDPECRKGRSLAAGETGFGRRRDLPGWCCFRCHAERDKDKRALSRSVASGTDDSAAKADERRRIEASREIYQCSRPIEPDDVVDRYLRGRGLRPLFGAWPASLRIADLEHPSDRGRLRRRHPAMVGIVTDDGGMVLAVHRTFLGRDGRKANVDKVKLALGPVGGRAVKLGPPSEAIVVAEGIESALAASTTFGRPAWAALSTGGLYGLRLPRSVIDVIIALDWDEPDRTGVGPGLRAALSLKASITAAAADEGRTVRVSLRPPPMGQRDYADLG